MKNREPRRWKVRAVPTSKKYEHLELSQILFEGTPEECSAWYDHACEMGSAPHVELNGAAMVVVDGFDRPVYASSP